MKLRSLVAFVLIAVAFASTATAASRYQPVLVDPETREVMKDLALWEDQRVTGDGKLFEVLKSPNALLRLRAVEVIGRIQDPADASYLIGMLEDAEAAVVNEAIFALGQMAAADAVEPLAGMFRDADDQRKGLIAEAMGKINSDEAVGHLITLLKEYDSDGRSEAALALARAANPEAVHSLLIAIHDPDPSVSRHAVYALEKIESDRVGEQILDMLDSDDHRIRSAVARTLGKQNYKDAVKPLIARLSDSDPHVAVNAAAALGELGKDKAVHPLGELSAKSEWLQIRCAAVRAIGEIGDKKGKDYLVQSLLDKSVSVRSSAIEALGKTIGDDVNVFVDPVLKDASRYVRVSAVRALGIGKVKDRIPFLIETATRHEDTMMRAAAMEALGKMDDNDKVGATLVAGLFDEDFVVAATAASAIAETKLESAVPDLIKSYNQRTSRNDINVRMEILRTIKTLETDKANGIATRGLDDIDPRVRQLSREILEQFDVEIPDGRTSRDIYKSMFDESRRRRLSPPLGLRHAVIETERGNIEIELFGDDAIQTTALFIHLTESGFYNGLNFHRMVPNFVIQGGDPRGDSWGDAGYYLRSEFNQWRYEQGFVGIAHDGKDTGGSQFFITHSPQHRLDGLYTIFGRVTKGMDVVWKIDRGDKITVRMLD